MASRLDPACVKRELGERAKHEQGGAVRERGDSEMSHYKVGLGKSPRAKGPLVPHVKDPECHSKVRGGLGFYCENGQENL